MPMVPEFMKRRAAFDREREAVRTMEDWNQFETKWFDSKDWPRRPPPERREGLILGGRAWAPTFWVYDLAPEARYEYFFTLRTVGDAARGWRPEPGQEGWRQECPFCEISTGDIGDATCPQCGRRLISVFYEMDGS